VTVGGKVPGIVPIIFFVLVLILLRLLAVVVNRLILILSIIDIDLLPFESFTAGDILGLSESLLTLTELGHALQELVAGSLHDGSEDP
jgi:membrane-bound ClpP family serine protease